MTMKDLLRERIFRIEVNDGKKFVICSHIDDVKIMLLGQAPHEMYDVMRMNGLYHIPMKTIDERVALVTKRRDELTKKLDACKKFRKDLKVY